MLSNHCQYILIKMNKIEREPLSKCLLNNKYSFYIFKIIVTKSKSLACLLSISVSFTFILKCESIYKSTSAIDSIIHLLYIFCSTSSSQSFFCVSVCSQWSCFTVAFYISLFLNSILSIQMIRPTEKKYRSMDIHCSIHNMANVKMNSITKYYSVFI